MCIYFDHSATTPVDKKVVREMAPYFAEKFGNASSIHQYGREAMSGVDLARQRTAKFLNCSPEEIIFTSGATESDNLAIRGLIKGLASEKNFKPHIITSLIEHDAVLEPCRQLEKEGAEVSYLRVNSSGIVSLADLEKEIKENTVLVSIMYVNSEIGSVQPLREIGKLIKKINNSRIREWQNKRPAQRGIKPQRIYFHTDATQGVNFFNCDTKHLHLDMLSLSGHKIYGPKGVGALYIKKDVPLKALQLGGHHENNRRSGTLNVPGIVGLGKALELLDEKSVENNNQKISKVRDYLVKEILEKIPDSILNTDRKNSSPAHAHFTFSGAEGESILISLDMEDIAVSTGSACASGSLEPSHVLLAIGIKKEASHHSIRFTLGKNSDKKDVDRLMEVLPPIIERLRKMNPLFNE